MDTGERGVLGWATKGDEKGYIYFRIIIRITFLNDPRKRISLKIRYFCRYTETSAIMETGTKQQKATKDLAVLEAYDFPKNESEPENAARCFLVHQILTISQAVSTS